jgi:putative hydrolase
MSDEPAEQGPDENPFKGTPFESIFAAFGQVPGIMPGAGAGGNVDLSAFMGQLQAMLAPHEGTVNWDLAKDTARHVVAAQPDPTPSAGVTSEIADALRLADHWVDSATDFPSGISTTAAWSRADWIEQTLPVWKRMVEPIAEHVVAAMGKAIPDEARSMAGPFLGLMNQAGGAMFGSQVGQALGGLATEVLTSTDIGLPLGPQGKAAMVPTNIAAFHEGLDVPDEDVLLYLALREAAHQRLFAHVPWLRGHVLGAVEEYGRGTTIDIGKIESSIAEIDPTNPAALKDALEGGLFEPEKTAAQQAALTRLETMLALIEGWVDDVVQLATHDRMPSAPKLAEVIRRRRAAGGPAEETFAALVGLELRPRRLRDAAALWGAFRSRSDVSTRDKVWSHPDLMPGPADLDDPLGFGERGSGDPADSGMSDADFDAAIAALLDESDE